MMGREAINEYQTNKAITTCKCYMELISVLKQRQWEKGGEALSTENRAIKMDT